MYLSRIYNRYMHGHDILNLIKARAQREPRTECRARLRAVQGRSEKRVFSAQTRGRKEDRRARSPRRRCQEPDKHHRCKSEPVN